MSLTVFSDLWIEDRMTIEMSPYIDQDQDQDSLLPGFNKYFWRSLLVPAGEA